MTNQRQRRDIRYQPLYTLSEVSRYARVRPSTLRYWFTPSESNIIARANQYGVVQFSFMNLIEAHVIAALRRNHHISLQKIRQAVEWAKKYLKKENPLAELEIETDGYNIFVKHLEGTINISQKGQLALREILAQYLKRIERDTFDVPTKFYPYPYDDSPKIVVMDPHIVLGRPVIVGTRITTAMVFDRYTGGESLTDIATDYDVQLPNIEEAIRCEIERRAA